MKRIVTIAILALLFVGTATTGDAGTLVENSGVKGGVVVHLGCGDGKSTASLFSGDKFLIYGLDVNADAVEEAKEQIASRDVYGQVSAETHDGKNLPLGDNIVNLVIVEDAAQVSAAEIERALVPNGVALVKSGSALLNSSGLKNAGTFDGWDRYRKPWPSDIDEWPQFLYDSSDNAVSRDRRVGKPRHLQWFAGPRHTRDHDALASMSAMTSSDGRVFYIFDEGPTSLVHQPAKWKLIARDAFNGKLLWKRNISSWMTHLYNFRAGPVQLPRRLVSVGGKVYATLSFGAPAEKLDGSTGKTLMTYAGSDDAEELIWHDGLLLVVKGDPAFWIDESPNCHGYWDIAEREEARIPKQIVAYGAETGELLWKVDDQQLKTLVPLSLGIDSCQAIAESLDGLDAGTSRPANLDRLQANATTSVQGPSINRLDGWLSAFSASRQVVSGLGETDDVFGGNVNHRGGELNCSDSGRQGQARASKPGRLWDGCPVGTLTRPRSVSWPLRRLRAECPFCPASFHKARAGTLLVPPGSSCHGRCLTVQKQQKCTGQYGSAG